MNTCCFINTDQLPLKIERLGLLQYNERHDIFTELCRVWYPHPEAPEDAKVDVLRFLPIDMRFFKLKSNTINVINMMKEISENVSCQLK